MTARATRAPADPQTGRRCDDCGDGRYAPKACSGCGRALCPACRVYEPPRREGRTIEVPGLGRVHVDGMSRPAYWCRQCRRVP